jgi:hypothetical protein
MQKDAEMAGGRRPSSKSAWTRIRFWVGAVFSQMRSANLDHHMYLQLDHHQYRCRLRCSRVPVQNEPPANQGAVLQQDVDELIKARACGPGPAKMYRGQTIVARAHLN